MKKTTLLCLIPLPLAACGKQDVETVQIPDYCQAVMRKMEGMTPEEQKIYGRQWGVMVRKTGYAGGDISRGWCMDCKTGHLYECPAFPAGE